MERLHHIYIWRLIYKVTQLAQIFNILLRTGELDAFALFMLCNCLHDNAIRTKQLEIDAC